MADDPVVANPTYMADIRSFFRPEDVQHMGWKGIDLGTYEGVKSNASNIYFQTLPPDPNMPPDEAGQWSANRSQTFANWLNNGCPEGTATPYTGTTSPTGAGAGGRLRKNVASLSQQEQDALKAAFQGLMDRDPKSPGDDVDPTSYYAIAGYHGRPRIWCAHHIDPFNPWHRAYLKIFEDALRSVPGCENVTLPYWDVSTELPSLLQEEPLASYELPKDPGGGWFPYTTSRYSDADIASNMHQYSVLADIDRAQIQSLWGVYIPHPAAPPTGGGYQRWSIQAHDSGHGSIGPTMAEQDVSAYDPVFWFYHCNIDRLWMEWQIKLQATTLQGFKTTLGTDLAWLPIGLNGFRPPITGAPITSADTIGGYDVSYEAVPAARIDGMELENKVGSLDARRAFTIKSSDPVSVRVKDIDRMNIPGSFAVHLLADGEPIAKRFFFQSSSPRECATCKEQPLVSIDFPVPQDQILDRKLSVEIEVPSQAEAGKRFPLSTAGNPTVNARLLLEDV
jgi:tyrosinase